MGKQLKTALTYTVILLANAAYAQEFSNNKKSY